MTAKKNSISVEEAIDLLRSGGDLGENIISNLETTKVKAMDALLLAENGFIVPDGNIVYDDRDVNYDPDFDEVDWGRPIAFKNGKSQLEAPSTSDELVVRVVIKNDEMKEWVKINHQKLDRVISKLLEDLYQTERLLKD